MKEDLPLYHFDVYRIGNPEEMYEIGYEDYFLWSGSMPYRMGKT